MKKSLLRYVTCQPFTLVPRWYIIPSVRKQVLAHIGLSRMLYDILVVAVERSWRYPVSLDMLRQDLGASAAQRKSELMRWAREKYDIDSWDPNAIFAEVQIEADDYISNNNVL